MGKWLEKIRAKDESAKKKIVWIGTAIAMIIVFLLWGVYNALMNYFFPPAQQEKEPFIPQNVRENIQGIGGAVSEFRDTFSELQTEIGETIEQLEETAQNATSTLENNPEIE